MDRLQFLESSITNDLRDDQILTVRNDLPSYRNRTSMVSALMAKVIQATTMSIPLPSKLWLLKVHMDEWLSTIRPTWVKGCQLSMIRVEWRPEWRVASYQWYDQLEWRVASYWRYEYNDNLSEGLPVITNTSAKMICVIVLSINVLMTFVVDNLCDYLFNQRLMICSHLLVWPMTYVVTGLCG